MKRKKPVFNLLVLWFAVFFLDTREKVNAVLVDRSMVVVACAKMVDQQGQLENEEDFFLVHKLIID